LWDWSVEGVEGVEDVVGVFAASRLNTKGRLCAVKLELGLRLEDMEEFEEAAACGCVVLASNSHTSPWARACSDAIK
jgi:hypothetical protein